MIRETALAFPVAESSLGGNLSRLPWATYPRAISPAISSSRREERGGEAAEKPLVQFIVAGAGLRFGVNLVMGQTRG